MFRKIAKANKALSEERCIEILKTTKRGVLAVLGDNEYPYAMPLNHYYDEETGKIYFHSGNYGHRKDAVNKHEKVSFCVITDGLTVEDHWGLDFQSVVVFGKMKVVTEAEPIREFVKKLSLKFTQDEAWIDQEIEDGLKATILLELTPEHITGKFVNES